MTDYRNILKTKGLTQTDGIRGAQTKNYEAYR
jgi:hypothetical protein